jgi:hypothetical protein
MTLAVSFMGAGVSLTGAPGSLIPASVSFMGTSVCFMRFARATRTRAASFFKDTVFSVMTGGVCEKAASL